MSPLTFLSFFLLLGLVVGAVPEIPSRENVVKDGVKEGVKDVARDVVRDGAKDVVEDGVKDGSKDVEQTIPQQPGLNRRHVRHMKHYIPRPGHEDHQLRHSLILLFIFLFIIFSQAALVQWKKQSYPSYMLATLTCLWVIPLVLFLSSGSFQLNSFSGMFMLIWVVFSASHFYIYKLASQKPIAITTPKVINAFLYFIYRFCFGLASIGGTMLFLNIIFFQYLRHFGLLFVGRWGFSALFYGLYFGLMGRDFAEYLSTHLASEMGFASKYNMAMPARSAPASAQSCGICQGILKRAKGEEQIIRLNCEHSFHISCVRGWIIVGKKDICPVCAEKVELGEVFESSFWAKKSIAWAQLLDSLRYLLVWNPLIVLLMQIIIYVLD